MHGRGGKSVHIYFCPLSFSLILPCVAKIGISAMSSAAGDNKLVEEPITSRWQAGGSRLSTCHYLNIDISKSPDRPFLRLPWQATMINLGKRKRGDEGRKGRKGETEEEEGGSFFPLHILFHFHNMKTHANCGGISVLLFFFFFLILPIASWMYRYVYRDTVLISLHLPWVVKLLKDYSLYMWNGNCISLI